MLEIPELFVNSTVKSAVVLLASGPSQQMDLIGGHSKLCFLLRR